MRVSVPEPVFFCFSCQLIEHCLAMSAILLLVFEQIGHPNTPMLTNEPKWDFPLVEQARRAFKLGTTPAVELA